MAIDYHTLPARVLLAMLETAGRAPDLDLIRACLERRTEITPGLLDSLAAILDDDWPEGDPRNYAGIHAGLLLIAFREPRALPIFADIFSDEDLQDLWDWFDTELPAYGPAIVPWAIELLDDPYAGEGRPCAVEILLQAAEAHPAERERIVQALRRHLPELGEDGRLVVSRGARVNPDPIWSWAAAALQGLEDAASAAQIEALQAEGLADEDVAEAQLICSALRSAAPGLRRQPGDIVRLYEGLRAEAARAGAPQEQCDTEAEAAAVLDEIDPGIRSASEPEAVEMLLTAIYEGTYCDGPWVGAQAVSKQMGTLSVHEELETEIPYQYVLLTLADDRARALTRETATQVLGAANRLLALLDLYERATQGAHPEWAKFIALAEAPFPVQLPSIHDTRDPDVIAVLVRDLRFGHSWPKMLAWLAQHGAEEHQPFAVERVRQLAAFEQAYGVDLADLLFSEEDKAENAELAADLLDDTDLLQDS